MTKSLLLALSGFVSFGSITLVILLLMSDNGLRNGIGYVLGYTLSYAIIGIIFIVLGFSQIHIIQEHSNILFPILYIMLGALFLFLGFWKLFHSKKKVKATHSFFISPSLKSLTPLKSFGFGAMVSVVNLKNLILFLSAVSVVQLSNFTLFSKIINTLLVTVVFCFVLILPIFMVLLFPKRSTKILHSIKSTLETHIHMLNIIFLIFFGLIFIFNGILKLV